MSAARAKPMPIEQSDEVLLIDIQGEAEKRGLVLITNGRELRYTLKHFPLPEGWTRFVMRVKPRLLDPRAPRA
jgi:hypothetical protein